MVADMSDDTGDGDVLQPLPPPPPTSRGMARTLSNKRHAAPPRAHLPPVRAGAFANSLKRGSQLPPRPPRPAASDGVSLPTELQHESTL